jgi:hypothetical protein
MTPDPETLRHDVAMRLMVLVAETPPAERLRLYRAFAEAYPALRGACLRQIARIATLPSLS